ncbi:MAG: hypothetical protein CMI52_01525 [Parcubacteria group bacterium]|nr:hypothetical protein [Parcubacteria group bacterium]|tara:strand:- start:231 stop:917 length:687 start_codon:yes stop_codon:yes gene_type:complete
MSIQNSTVVSEDVAEGVVHEPDSPVQLYSVDTDDVMKRSIGAFIFVNILTFMRAALVIPVIILLHSAYTVDHLTAFVIAIIAGNLDWMDGFFARKLKVASRFGQFADPMADKIYFLAALIALYEHVKIPLIVLIVAIEGFLIVHRIWVLARKRTADVSANNFGKYKAILQNVVICALILGEVLSAHDGAMSRLIIDWLGLFLLYISLGYSFLSAAGHIRKHGMIRMRW